MTGVVFKETLRRNWRAALYLTLGVLLMVAYMFAMVNDSKLLEQYAAIFKAGSFFIDMFAGGDAAFIGTPAGMLNYGVFTWTVLLLAGYAVVVGLNVTANEEERGTLDVLLSAPIPRWKLVLEKLLAQAVLFLGIALIIFLSLVVGAALSPSLELNIGRLLDSSLNLLPSMLLALAFTTFVATLVRRRNTAATIAAVFVVASYFVDMIARAVQAEIGEVIRSVAYFKYFDSINVMKNGLNWGNIALLLGVTVLLVAGTVWLFQRRDISV